MANKTMTAPLAVVKVNGRAVGYMKSIRISEQFQRARVTGLGQLITQELPITSWNGTLSCGFYSISLRETGIPGATRRDAENVSEFTDQLLLQSEGVDVVIYRKVTDQTDAVTGLKTSRLAPYCVVRGVYLEREGMDINEGQVAGQNQEFVYLNPVLFSDIPEIAAA